MDVDWIIYNNKRKLMTTINRKNERGMLRSLNKTIPKTASSWW